MNMRIKPVVHRMLVAVLMAVPPALLAQTSSTAPGFRQEQLDQILAPIALYPDALLVQIFMASTYPLEIVQADRWVKGHSQLQGDGLTTALEQPTWDPSMKSLVNFPQVLAMMVVAERLAEEGLIGG